MGAPINSFRVFSELAKAGKEARQHEAFKQFRLFSFILHSPAKHSEFHNYLENNLHFLDARARSGKLIFFTLVKPSKEFIEVTKRKTINRRYIAEIRSIEEGIGIGDNEEASVFILCHDLKIPESDLPCIVVTNNFIDEVVWFRTNKMTLAEDITELNCLAEFENENSIMSKIRESRKFISIHYLERNLAKIIATALSFNTNGAFLGGRSMADDFHARKIVRSKMNMLLRGFDDIKLQAREEKGNLDICADSEESNALLNYEELITNLLNELISGYESRSLRYEPKAYERILEPKSYKFLLSGFKVIDLFESDHNFDFSCAVMSMAKALENEINCSIVQTMRKALDISMPEYYCKYHPTFKGNACVGKTNLNHKDSKGNWKPLTLGVSKVVTDIFTRKSRFNPIFEINTRSRFTRKSYEDFRSMWEKVRLLRNDAGHSEMLTIDDGISVIEIFEKMRHDRHLLNISDIRNNLRTNSQTNS